VVPTRYTQARRGGGIATSGIGKLGLTVSIHRDD